MEVPCLRHLTIILNIEGSMPGSFTRILEPLATLRALNVDTCEVLPVYPGYLKSVIKGNEPKDRLSRMYVALQNYAPIDWAESLLQKACDDMENADLKGFIRTRKDVIARVRCLRWIYEEGLYKYDKID